MPEYPRIYPYFCFFLNNLIYKLLFISFMSTVKLQSMQRARAHGDTEMTEKTLQILELSSSGRQDGSITRRLSNELITTLEDRHGSVDVTRRNLGAGMPFLNESWIEANFTPD